MSTAEETQKSDTPKKSKSKVKEKSSDPGRFHGNGVNFKAKLIGIEEVPEPRGDRMCQEAMQKLKGLVKSAGEHKLRILINVSLEGLKILEEKTGNLCHHHAVHKISFIARDVTDARAFGYIFSPGDGKHKFFGIKTEKAAEALVLTLRDLFQVVFEMKKKEVEEAKKQKEMYDNRENLRKEDHMDRTSQDSRDSNRSETPQQVRALSKYPAAGGTNKPDINVGNLLNLENELETLEQGLQQINIFGQQQYEGVPPSASPSDWSAGSDSWGTPATPQSVSLSASGSQSVLPSHKDGQETVLSAGGGFPTIPRPGYQASSASMSPAAAAAAAATIHRPRSIQSGGSFSTPPPKAAGWATFDSPSPTGTCTDTQPPADDFDANFSSVQPSTQTQISAKLEAKLQVQSSKVSTMACASANSSVEVPSAKNDPFQVDPFFKEESPFGVCVHSSTLNTAQPVSAQSDAFNDFRQSTFMETTDVSQTNSEGNPFSDSVFEPATSMASPPEGHGPTLNTAFASTPIQSTDGDMRTKDPFNSLMALGEETKIEMATTPDVMKGAVSKPADLAIGQAEASVLAPASDPFGAVSPATEAKLSTSVAVSDDPFDTSSFLMPKSRGPLDLSQLKPISLNKAGPQDGSDINSELSVIVENHEDSPPEPPMPSPKVPPPPLPSTTAPTVPSTSIIPPASKQLMQDEAPPPPPRTTVPAPLRPQATIDVCAAVPPPIPKRPPVSDGNSPKLLRQATIHFPMEDDTPPPPPPRPGLGGTDKSRLGAIGRTESLGAAEPPPPPPRPATKSSDLPAVDMMQSKPKLSSVSTRTSISPIPRPRPRPRSKTPANTSSGFSLTEDIRQCNTERPSSAADFRDPFGEQRSSFGKCSLNTFEASFQAFASETKFQQENVQISDRSQSPAVVTKKEVFQDPFADVDPFASDDKSDPFDDMPDPFTMDSPMDPFSKDFKGELFTTKAVTVSVGETPNPEKQNAKGDSFDLAGFDSSLISGQGTQTQNDSSKGNYLESTLRTDTSLEASVSLPFAYSTDSNPLSNTDESSGAQNGRSEFTSEESHSKKSDPFEFDVFSSDFFKNQFNNTSSKTNSSWVSITDSAATSKTNDNNVSSLPTSIERVSPGLTPSSIPSSNNKDGDSSSNSEIADAFGDDSAIHQVGHLTLASDGQSQAQVGNIFGNPFM